MGGGPRRMAGNGPVRSLQVGSRLVAGRREQSGITNNRPRDCVNNGCSGKVQHSTWSVHLIGVKFARRNLFSCLHFETISDRLLSRSFLGVVRMWNFSAVHTCRLHFFDSHLYDRLFSRTFHVMVNGFPSLFSSHTLYVFCELSAVCVFFMTHGAQVVGVTGFERNIDR